MKPISFIASSRVEQARNFYENILELEFVADETIALVFSVDDHPLRIQKVQNHNPVDFTVFGFEVENIEQKITELKDKGVQFEEYEQITQDDLGIWTTHGTKVAWFEDPDGNTLSLVQLQ